MKTECFVFARIDRDGQVLSSSNGNLSVERISEGRYQAIFSTPLVTVPSIVATCVTHANANSRIATAQNCTENGFELVIKKSGNNDLQDCDWNFIATYEDETISSGTPLIGQEFEGGTVFWLDETGVHGLAVTNEDQSDSIGWNNGVDHMTNAQAKGVYSGAVNTTLIIAQQTSDNPSGSFAAKCCADLEVQANVNYGGWYLPSVEEWSLLNQALLDSSFPDIGINPNDVYWTSTEVDANQACMVTPAVTTAYGFDWMPKSTTCHVRAIRRF